MVKYANTSIRWMNQYFDRVKKRSKNIISVLFHKLQPSTRQAFAPFNENRSTKKWLK